MEYKVEVTSGEMVAAGTYDYIYITLMGSQGQSERTELNNYGVDFSTSSVGSYTVRTKKSLGEVLLVKLEKEAYSFLPENEWFCSKIVVTTPDGDAVLFPCHRWVSRGEHVELRGGRARKVFEDDHPFLTDHRKHEGEFRKELYQWTLFAEGLPYIGPFKNNSDLPSEVRFSMSRGLDFIFSRESIVAALKLKGLADSAETWKSFEDMKNIFWLYKTQISEYIFDHWMEDDFYGYQLLNGINPNVIQICRELPANFPVTEEMVQPFLEQGTSLMKEIKEGNVFICDYKLMEGLPTALHEGKPAVLTAGLCLLYMNSQRKLVPIAIQLGQQPSPQNLIFLPSDPQPDWLLAKIFLRNVDTLLHQGVFHFMNTHLLAEVFTIATSRNFPVIHPLYKILIPHFRYTLQINTAAREGIVGPEGVLTTSSALAMDGLTELLRRYLSQTTYSSLCLPDNIAARGLESVPNFYYRDDGLKLWNIINRFVQAMVRYYYPSNSEVSRDSELQDWINDIFTYGFLGNESSGIPKCFQTVEEVIKFITMVIYTVSAQHSAVNNGQFDFASWIPNSPLLLRKDPPSTKGQSSMDTILETLANVGNSVIHVGAAQVLSQKLADFTPLGTYPNERFDEPVPKRIIEDFQAELSSQTQFIEKRNAGLEIPYNYLDPPVIENSVSI